MAQVHAPHPVAAGPPLDRRTITALALFVAWTGFVWFGRIRNAVSDPALSAADRQGPVLLALSFLLPAAVIAVVLVLASRHRSGFTSWQRGLVYVLAGWTTAVWIVRAGDIALGGDHAAAFVAVHTALALVSIGLAGWAVTRLRST